MTEKISEREVEQALKAYSGMGNVKIGVKNDNIVLIKDVWYVPGMKSNLMSLKYELELQKIFELINCKSTITHVETNPKLDFDVEGDDVDATTFKQLVGSLRYLCNTRPDICYAFGMTLIGANSELTKEILLDISSSICEDQKIKVSKPVNLMIDNQSSISLVKNPVLHGRSKRIDTKFHFLCNQVLNRVLEVIHYSTHKQLADVQIKAIKTEYFIYLKDGIDVVDYN
ncbi:uncharacterized protein LOC127095083 [Lathyrus oleraceus]|uniref:uncharacterized protein LOC127095083 n=1 Tax=Pisum sativum TaxID=3888 RepID=UPI0021D1913B|nr:uncharacterized protein LOC127095083 [Pisum sativum]